MVLLDNYIHNILKESIDNVLNNRKLYHQTSNNFNVIKSILTNGLQPNDNGEAYGVWFSEDEPFYSSNRAPLFSIPNTEDIRQKYKFSTLYDGNIKIATKPISIEDITVESIPFAILENNSLLFTDGIKRLFNSFGIKQGFGSIAEYIAEKHKDKKILIYVDLFDKFVEQGTWKIFAKYNNIIPLF